MRLAQESDLLHERRRWTRVFQCALWPCGPLQTPKPHHNGPAAGRWRISPATRQSDGPRSCWQSRGRNTCRQLRLRCVPRSHGEGEWSCMTNMSPGRTSGNAPFNPRRRWRPDNLRRRSSPFQIGYQRGNQMKNHATLRQFDIATRPLHALSGPNAHRPAMRVTSVSGLPFVCPLESGVPSAVPASGKILVHRSDSDSLAG